MIYAQILNGTVQNAIVIDDVTLVPLFSEGFDACLRVDNINPRPGVGWSFDGENFTAPPEPPLEEESEEGDE